MFAPSLALPLLPKIWRCTLPLPSALALPLLPTLPQARTLPSFITWSLHPPSFLGLSPAPDDAPPSSLGLSSAPRRPSLFPRLVAGTPATLPLPSASSRHPMMALPFSSASCRHLGGPPSSLGLSSAPRQPSLFPCPVAGTQRSSLFPPPLAGTRRWPSIFPRPLVDTPAALPSSLGLGLCLSSAPWRPSLFPWTQPLVGTPTILRLPSASCRHSVGPPSSPDISLAPRRSSLLPRPLSGTPTPPSSLGLSSAPRRPSLFPWPLAGTPTALSLLSASRQHPKNPPSGLGLSSAPMRPSLWPRPLADTPTALPLPSASCRHTDGPPSSPGIFPAPLPFPSASRRHLSGPPSSLGLSPAPRQPSLFPRPVVGTPTTLPLPSASHRHRTTLPFPLASLWHPDSVRTTIQYTQSSPSWVVSGGLDLVPSLYHLGSVTQ